MRILGKLNGWKLYLLIYAALLLLSHLVVSQFETDEFKGHANQHMELQAVSKEGNTLDRYVRVDYEKLYDEEDCEKPAIIMLPGDAEGPEVFEQLAQNLKDQFRVIIPYLPGDGTPKEELPSYSFKSLAAYSDQIADTLGLDKVHIIGYGMGGASAIYWAKEDTAQLASLSLISSIGVQELELLGSHRLNHTVRTVQLAVVWFLHNLIPHFGLLNEVGVNVPYAKSLYESDLRPLRSYLMDYKEPMLILHGTEDPLVPVAAAQEHSRLVPQSRLVLYKTGHDLLETRNNSIAEEITAFIKQVEQGQAVERTEASKKRLERAERSFSNIQYAPFEGASLLLLVLIIILSTWISEDLTCIGAGLLAARGLIGFWPAVGACFIGVLIGDVGLYATGRLIGRKAVDKIPFKWILSRSALDKSAEWFHRRGPVIILVSRFLPGSRLPTYFSAGVIGARFWMFIAYFLISTLIWTPMMVGISKLLGGELINYFSVFQDYALWTIIALLFLTFLIIKVAIPAFSQREGDY